MDSQAINEQQVHSFLSRLLEEDLHAKRVLSLALATLGVIHAASLSVYAIGQALAVARGAKGQHGVKQVNPPKDVTSRTKQPSSRLLIRLLK